MLSDKEVTLIQHQRGGKFKVDFIRRFDKEWSEITEKINNLGIDLRKIVLVMYQNMGNSGKDNEWLSV